MEEDMKRTLLVTGLAAAVFMAPALQANAINREWSAALGFLGGYLVANGGLCAKTVYQEPVYIERPVYHETVVVEEPVVTGHYEYREERIWTPGYWECRVTSCGHEERVWHEGYYRSELVKVWVDDGRRGFRRVCRR
jgi:hypothetical protein